MKTKITVVIIIAAFLLAFSTLSGCIGTENAKEYFPTKVGSEWSYKIKFGDVNPQLYYIIFWGQERSGFTGIPHADRILKDTYPNPENIHLKIKAGKIVSSENGYAAILNIIEDDLGLFTGSVRVHWAVRTDENRFIVMQYVMYPAAFYDVSESDVVYTMRVILFDPQTVTPGSSTDWVDNDQIRFVGFEKESQYCPLFSCMHFIRTVQTKSGINFTEETWFGKGIGLVRLEQKVNGQTSMTWTLESFIKG